MKEEFLKLQDDDELEMFENKVLFQKRNELYNEILDDPEMKEHLFKILKRNQEVAKLLEDNEGVINNLLMINGAPPIDDFDELEEDDM